MDYGRENLNDLCFANIQNFGPHPATDKNIDFFADLPTDTAEANINFHSSFKSLYLYMSLTPLTLCPDIQLILSVNEYLL